MSEGTDSWRELQALFDLIDGTAEEERLRVLEAACPDPEMRARVMRMVRGANQESAPSGAHAEHSNLPPRVGPYHVLRLLGSGGIGTVYLAERLVGGAPQRVAIKVLSPHAAGQHFVERFHREQHILALLDHANITRLLDAGLSDTGQPYLVMDFVEGVHLDEYCDGEVLGMQARIEIFLQVCEAIAHAHRNLVVHLDLKPSNILVNTEGTVKLLDFGTSKLIQPDVSVTTTILATPAYASPEQLRNEPVTTACDIYSLGAILFYLLTGEVEGGRRSAALAIERAFKETQPQHLSSADITEEMARTRGSTASRLKRMLDDDIDTIVGKCLSPRPAERYPSVDALILDLKRYQRGQAILARPQTIVYRMGKFVRRNRGGVTASAVLILLVMGSLAYAAWHQHLALREGARAIRMQTFMATLFRLANPDYTGKPAATVPELLQLGLKRLPQVVFEEGDRRQLQLGLAESLYFSGGRDEALAVLLQIAESAAKDADAASEAEASAYAGRLEIEKGDVPSGRKLEARALALVHGRDVPSRVRVLAEAYYAFNEDNNGYRTDANLALLRKAWHEAQQTQLDPSDRELILSYLALDLDLRGGHEQEVRAMNEQLLTLYGDDPLNLCERSHVYGELAWMDDIEGDPKSAIPLFEKAHQGYLDCSGPDSSGALDVLPYWSDALVGAGRPGEALSLLENALPTWRRVVGGNPDYGDFLVYLARTYLVNGRPAQAEQAASELLTLISKAMAPGDRAIGVAHLLLGQALVAQHRFKEAQPHAREAATILTHGETPHSRQWDQQAAQLQVAVNEALPPGA